MIVKVHMLAFMEANAIRPVWVPDECAASSPEHILENVFYYGQNNFTHLVPKEHQVNELYYSVSMGDVAELNNEFWICCAVGWRKLTPAELEEYKRVPRRDRSFYHLVRNY